VLFYECCMNVVQDGVESVRQLRAWEKEGSQDHCRQYILGASACVREETRHDAMDVGMDDFVLKPLEISELLETLNSLHTPFEQLL
jgi:CheY-like chemotaxis protein